MTEDNENDYIVTCMVSFTTANGVSAKNEEEAKLKGFNEIRDSLKKSSLINIDDLDIEVSYIEED